MTDLTPETIAHLRDLDAARTQGAWHHIGNSIAYESGRCTCYGGTLPHGHEPMCGLDQIGDAAEPDAEFIAAAANHMGALLDTAEELSEARRQRLDFVGALGFGAADVSRLRAELAEARAVADDLAEHGLRFDLNPTMPTWEEGWTFWHDYVGRMDVRAREIGAQLRAALAPVTQREGGE